MKKLILFLVTLPACLVSQVSVQLSLARTMPPGSTHELRMRIAKGASTDYSKLELRVPDGASVLEGDVKGGTFTFQDGQVKIIWAITPAGDTLESSMKLTAPLAAGTYSIQSGYFFMNEEAKSELVSEPFVFTVGEPGSAPADSGYVSLATQSVAAAAVPTLQTNTDVKDAEQRRMLPHQLRKDSRDAQLLGETEKAKAVDNLEDMKTILRQVDYLEDPELKEKVSRKVSVAQRRANRDLETAEKILALARSLEEQADRIQKENEASGKSEPAENPGKSAGSTTSPAKTASSASGLVYRIQVGAFTRKPMAGEFSSVGSVSIMNEGGLYKVVTGEFPSRESARSKRDELRQKGYDAFVVGYKGGVRVE